jgi:hypothetical protein
MNLLAELDRLTEPSPRAGKARILSRDEIERLTQTGAVTPIDAIPALRYLHKVNFSPDFCRRRW